MYHKIIIYLKDLKNYLFITGYGLYVIYKKIFQKLLLRIRYFNLREFIYYTMIGYSVILTGTGWRSYEILINEEIIHHSISTNDFLIFLTGFFIMTLPGILKFIAKFENSKLNKICFLSGLSLATVFYAINFKNPSRISSTPEASFTIWFYFFGINIIFLWISGLWIMKVPGISSMPSTRLKN